jgi:hypothetical protein
MRFETNIVLSEAFSRKIDALVPILECNLDRKRKMSVQSRQKFKQATRTIVGNLVRAKLGYDTLSISKDYNARKSATIFLKVFDSLISSGYVNQIHAGFYDRNSNRGAKTRVEATIELLEKISYSERDALQNLSTIPDREIELRDKSGNVLSWKQSVAVRQMSRNVATINAVLAPSTLALSGQIPMGVDRTSQCLKRIFNNGSFEQGGRFYGGWWQSVPSDLRRMIQICGEATIELDFKALHPTILYGRRGEMFAGDPYTVVPGSNRQHAKLALNAMLNAKNRRIRKPDGFDDESTISWSHLQREILEAHRPIAEQFYTGVGLELQYIDSQIAERVLLHFAAMGIPCLPVHDSFVVQARHKTELMNAMTKSSKNILGFTIDAT